MKFLQIAKDGGKDSHVTGFFIAEIKPLFSVVLLYFAPGSREAFHSHAFNAVTLWLFGRVKEYLLNGSVRNWTPGQVKYTPRNCFHKVDGLRGAVALSFRGPWAKTWREYIPGSAQFVRLSSGRKVVNED